MRVQALLCVYVLKLESFVLVEHDLPIAVRITVTAVAIARDLLLSGHCAFHRVAVQIPLCHLVLEPDHVSVIHWRSGVSHVPVCTSNNPADVLVIT